MLLALLIAAGIVIYVMRSSAEARRRVDARRREVLLAAATETLRLNTVAAKEALQRWTFTEIDSVPSRTTWILDFRSMRLATEWLSPEFGDRESLLQVRRVDGSRWEAVETDDSFKANVARLERRRAAESEDDREVTDEEIGNLQKADGVWFPLDERHVPAIETAYQRYIHAASF